LTGQINKFRSTKEIINKIDMLPDKKESTINNRYNAYKEISGRIIKVTYKESKEEIYVITAVIKKSI